MPKCKVCKKKVISGVTEFKCKCGAILCLTHRYPENHICTIDYKTQAREKLQQENQKIVADKVHNRI